MRPYIHIYIYIYINTCRYINYYISKKIHSFRYNLRRTDMLITTLLGTFIIVIHKLIVTFSTVLSRNIII